MEWGEDRATTLGAYVHDHFDLVLTPATRSIDALVVDDVRRGPKLAAFDRLARATAVAPARVRREIANALTVTYRR